MERSEQCHIVVQGIGLCCPGVVDFDAQKIVNASNLPNLKDFSITRTVEERLRNLGVHFAQGMRIEIENDANAALVCLSCCLFCISCFNRLPSWPLEQLLKCRMQC